MRVYQNDTHIHYTTFKTTSKNLTFPINFKNKHNIDLKIQINKSKTYTQIMVKLCKTLEQLYIAWQYFNQRYTHSSLNQTSHQYTLNLFLKVFKVWCLRSKISLCTNLLSTYPSLFRLHNYMNQEIFWQSCNRATKVSGYNWRKDIRHKIIPKDS